MYRTIYIKTFFILLTLIQGVPAQDSHLLMPTKGLFSHPRHNKILETLKIQCSECHNFSIKGVEKGPLAQHVNENFLKWAMSASSLTSARSLKALLIPPPPCHTSPP